MQRLRNRVVQVLIKANASNGSSASSGGGAGGGHTLAAAEPRQEARRRLAADAGHLVPRLAAQRRGRRSYYRRELARKHACLHATTWHCRRCPC